MSSRVNRCHRGLDNPIKYSPESFHEAVHCHQKLICALLWPAFGDGKDGPVDILGVGQDITALSFPSAAPRLWQVVDDLPGDLRLVVVLRGRKGEVFDGICVYQHCDLSEDVEVVDWEQLCTLWSQKIPAISLQMVNLDSQFLFNSQVRLVSPELWTLDNMSNFQHQWEICLCWEVLGHWLNWQALGSSGGEDLGFQA